MYKPKLYILLFLLSPLLWRGAGGEVLAQGDRIPQDEIKLLDTTLHKIKSEQVNSTNPTDERNGNLNSVMSTESGSVANSGTWYYTANGGYCGLTPTGISVTTSGAPACTYITNVNIAISGSNFEYWNGSAWVGGYTQANCNTYFYWVLSSSSGTTDGACGACGCGGNETNWNGQNPNQTWTLTFEELDNLCWSCNFGYTVTVTYAAAYTNDYCCAATPITLNNNYMGVAGSYNGSITGTTTGATADGPNSACFTVFNNMWYTFTAPVAGNYFVDIIPGTMTYPCISIRTGACGAQTEVACAGATSPPAKIYDSDYSTSSCAGGANAIPNGYSPFSFFGGEVGGSTYSYAGICSVAAGAVVYVMVDSYGALGTYTINVATLKNDNIAAPLIINACGTTFNSTTIGATNCGNGIGDGCYNNLDNATTNCSASVGGCGNAGGPGTACNANGTSTNGGDVGYSVENDSWYEFCVTTTSTLTLTFAPTMASCLVTGAGSGLQISIFTGTATNLTKIDGGYCSMNITASTAYTEVLAANTCVFVEVDGYGGTNCNYSLNAAISPSCVLPVKLLSFTGTNEQGKIKLDWSSAEEQNAGKYVITRSDNGIDYKPIITTKAKGNTTQTTDYTAYDENPIMNGINYYSLNEYDLNGAGGLLAQTFVSNTAGFPHFRVYPNPSNGKVNINIYNFGVPSVAIDIVDVYGRTVYTSTIDLANGSSLQQVDLSMLEAGVYIVKTSDGTNFYKQSLVISKN
ncbi:MAG: T9SS type A sorting domain-containing protein [Bacteroidia bacterium]